MVKVQHLEFVWFDTFYIEPPKEILQTGLFEDSNYIGSKST